MGCALLVSDEVYSRIGGFDESYFAYYEEVDYCLRARAEGMVPRVEPGAEIAHVGHRGFGSGFTGASAYLKARNLWTLGRRRNPAGGMLAFAPGYFVLTAVSAALYMLRGRADVASAIFAGARAGIRGEQGAPPAAFLADAGAAGRQP